MKTSERILLLGLCAIMLVVAVGCEQGQKDLLAEVRAERIAEDLDRKMYFSLHQKEVVRATVREHLRELYVTDCDLR